MHSIKAACTAFRERRKVSACKDKRRRRSLWMSRTPQRLISSKQRRSVSNSTTVSKKILINFNISFKMYLFELFLREYCKISTSRSTCSYLFEQLFLREYYKISTSRSTCSYPFEQLFLREYYKISTSRSNFQLHIKMQRVSIIIIHILNSIY